MKKRGLLLVLVSLLPLGVLFAQEKLEKYLPRYTYKKPQFSGETTLIEVKPEIEAPNVPDSMLSFKMDVTKRLNSILDYVVPDVTVKVRRPGWRVMVYSGKDRSEAYTTREKCYNYFDDHTPYLDFARPNYRVKVGDFLSREDARQLYLQAKRRFSTAVIVPDEVTVIKKADKDDLIELQRQEYERNLQNRRRAPGSSSND